MNRGPKGRYTKEFREQAVKPVLVDGLSQREVAGRLSLSVETLGAWVETSKKHTATVPARIKCTSLKFLFMRVARKRVGLFFKISRSIVQETLLCRRNIAERSG